MIEGCLRIIELLYKKDFEIKELKEDLSITKDTIKQCEYVEKSCEVKKKVIKLLCQFVDNLFSETTRGNY